MTPAAASILLCVLAQMPSPSPGPSVAAAAAQAVEPAIAGSDGQPHFRGALELSPQAYPAPDYFLLGTPILSFEAGNIFAVELGANLRLGVPSLTLRMEDWDELSDFGQVLRQLRVGEDGGVIQLSAGAFGGYTLGNGQLISRYSNRLNANYHPAGANLAFFIGPTRTELFASDVLGGRLFAGELAVDLGRTIGAGPEVHDRYHLALSVAHDFGRAGGVAPPLTLAWLELDAALLRAPKGQLSAYAGAGGRVQDDGSSLGATVGVAGEALPPGARLGGRLEARKQNSGFRQGMVGFDYELARFSAIGLSGVPLAEDRLPDTFSFYAELAAAVGGTDAATLEGEGLVASASAEYFTSGRTNVDASVQARVLNGRGAIGARFAAVGLGETPRYVMTVEARYRFMPSMYALASGGNLYLPRADGTLQRGVVAAIGVGADFAR